MSKAITTTTNTTAVSVFSQPDLEFIKKQMFPTSASQSDIEYCLKIASEFKLNPILKQIFFVERKAKEGDRWISKVDPMVGRDGFLNIAHRSGKKFSIRTTTTVKLVPKLDKGKWVESSDLVATCTVDVQGQIFEVEVQYGEYVQKTKEGNPTKFWSEKPDTMIKKVAESQCLRKAFDVQGLYSAEELGVGISDKGDLIIDTEAVNAIPAKPEKSAPQRLKEFLSARGIEEASQMKAFVDSLGISSKDVDKIEALLKDEGALENSIIGFLHPDDAAKSTNEDELDLFS